MLTFHTWMSEPYMTIKATRRLGGGVVDMNKQTAVLSLMSKC